MLGCIKRLELRFCQDTEQEHVMESFLTFIENLISQWGKIDYLKISKIKYQQSQEIGNGPSNGITDSENLFWATAHPGPRLYMPAGLMYELFKIWAASTDVPGENTLRAYYQQNNRYIDQCFHEGKQKGVSI